jgi:hypothetical protein
LLDMYYGRQEREHLLIMSLIRVATQTVTKLITDLPSQAAGVKPVVGVRPIAPGEAFVGKRKGRRRTRGR